MAQSDKKVRVCLAGNSDKGVCLAAEKRVVGQGKEGVGVLRSVGRSSFQSTSNKSIISQPLHFMHKDETALPCFLTVHNSHSRNSERFR